jgi:hypothetical protein
VAEPSSNKRGSEEKATRRAAHELIAAYHQEQLGALLERVRDGFAQLDRGEIDEFDLDDLIHRYKRAAGDLWKFCGSTGGSGYGRRTCSRTCASREESRTGGREARNVPMVVPEHPTPDASVSEQPA